MAAYVHACAQSFLTYIELILKIKPVLSICIPTYNRCNYLEDTLKSIIVQLTPEVEIVISDNASTDQTELIVGEFSKKYKDIIYSRAEKNNGPDANFLRVVSLGRGEYCWLLSDDDTIMPGGIATILQAIKDQCDIYTFNETTCDNKMKPIIKRRRLIFPDGRLEYNFSVPTDLQLFFQRSDPVGGIPFGLISVLVFRKAIWDAIVVPDFIMGTAYVHVYILFAGKERGTRLKFIPKSLIMNRLNDSYISTDPIRSFWITANGYQLLADCLFSSEPDVLSRKAFLAIAKRIFSIRHISMLRIYSLEREEWQRIEVSLSRLGYNHILLKVIGLSRMPLLGMRFLLQKARYLINKY